jgi:N-acetylneuraminic acid mutarotase
MLTNIWRAHTGKSQAKRQPFRRRTSAAGCFRRPSLERLEDRTVLSVSGTQAAQAITQIQTGLSSLDSTLQGVLSSLKTLPFLGNELGAVRGAGSALNSSLQSAQSNIPAVIGATSVTLFSDGAGDSITATSPSDGVLDLTVHANLASQQITTSPAGLGNFLQVREVPNQPLTLGTTAALQVEVDCTGTTPTLTSSSFNSLGLSVSLTGAFEATLAGLLDAYVQDHNGATDGVPGGLSAAITVPVVGALGNFGSPTASVNANLDLGLGFGHDPNNPSQPMPGLPLDLHLGTDFVLRMGSDGSVQKLAFDATTLGVGGTLIHHFIEPIAEQVAQFLAPVQPILTFFNSEVPILKDFGVHETFLDLAKQSNLVPQDITNAITALSEFDTLVQDINKAGTSGDATISLGNFDLTKGDQMSFASFIGQDFAAGQVQALTSDLQSVVGSVLDVFGGTGQIIGEITSADSDVGTMISEVISGHQYGFQMPILTDPQGTLLQMLMGQNPNLFTFEMEPITGSIDALLGVDLGILGLGLQGDLTLTIDFSAGYDAKGILKAASDIISGTGNPLTDILDGFYVNDQPTYDANGLPVDTGTGLHLHGDLTAFATIPAVTLVGGIHADVDLQLSQNLTHDGNKVRLSDLLPDFLSDPFDTFALHGDVYADANINIGLNLGIIDITVFSYQLAKAEIVDFGTQSNPPQPPSSGPVQVGEIRLNLQPSQETIYVKPYVASLNDAVDGGYVVYTGIEVDYPNGTFVDYLTQSELFNGTYPNGVDLYKAPAGYYYLDNSTVTSGDQKIVVETLADPNSVSDYGEFRQRVAVHDDAHVLPDYSNPQDRKNFAQNLEPQIWNSLSSINLDLSALQGTTYIDVSQFTEHYPGTATLIGGTDNNPLTGNTLIGGTHEEGGIGRATLIAPNNRSATLIAGRSLVLANGVLVFGPQDDKGSYLQAGTGVGSDGKPTGAVYSLVGGQGNDWFEVPLGTYTTTNIAIAADQGGNELAGNDTLHVVNEFEQPTTVTSTSPFPSESIAVSIPSPNFLDITKTRSDIPGEGQITAQAITRQLEISNNDDADINIDLPDPVSLGTATVAVDFNPAFTDSNTVTVHDVNSAGEAFTLLPDTVGGAILKVEAHGGVTEDAYLSLHGMTSADLLVVDAGSHSDDLNLTLDPSYDFSTYLLGSVLSGSNLRINVPISNDYDTQVFAGRGEVVIDATASLLGSLNNGAGSPLHYTVSWTDQLHSVTLVEPSGFTNDITVNEAAIKQNGVVVDEPGPLTPESLTIDGGNGADYTVEIENASGSVTWTAGAQSVENKVTVGSDARAAQLNLTGGGSSTTFDVPLSAYPVALQGVQIVGSAGPTVSITGNGVSTLTVDDPYSFLGNTYTIDTNGVGVLRSGTHPSPLPFQGFADFADQINISGLFKLILNTAMAPFVTVNAEADPTLEGTDVNAYGLLSNAVFVTPTQQDITNINDLLVNGFGKGPATLTIDDQNDAKSNETYTLGQQDVSRVIGYTTFGNLQVPLSARISYYNIGGLTLNTGASANTFDINAPNVPLLRITDRPLPVGGFGGGVGAGQTGGSTDDTAQVDGLNGQLLLDVQKFLSTNLSGPLTLNYAILSAINGAQATPGGPFTIVDADAPGTTPPGGSGFGGPQPGGGNSGNSLTGAFDNLPDGTTFTTPDGLKLQISYQGDEDSSGPGVQVTYLATPPTITSVNLPTAAVEGEPVLGSVTFAAPDPGESHIATISWGDNSASQTINLAPGVFSFSLNHTYAEDTSAVNVQITVSDPYPIGDGFGPAATTSQTLRVADAPITLATGSLALSGGSPLVLVEGQPVSGPVATFYDPGSDGTTADYGAVINWGDGATSSTAAGSASIVALGNNLFAVYGNHTFAGDEGTAYQIGVVVTDAGGAVASVPLTWQSAPAMTGPQPFSTAVTGNDGRIYVFGGNSINGPTSAADVFDPASGTWVGLAPMNTQRTHMAGAVDAAGRLYAIGGLQIDPATGATAASSTVEVFDPSVGYWVVAPSLPTAVSGAAAVTGKDGKIYVIGGATATGVTNLVQVYDPSTGTWTYGPSMPTARVDLAAVSGPGGLIYALGGADNSANPLGTVEVFDPSNAQSPWTTGPSLPTPRYGLGAAVGPDGNIYAIGGSTPFQVFNTVEAYDPNLRQWHTAEPLGTARAYMGVAVGSDGAIYAIGGIDSNFNQLTSVEVLAPAPTTVTDPVATTPYNLQVSDPLPGTTNTITIQPYRGAADEIIPDDIRVLLNGSLIYQGNIESLSGITINGNNCNDTIDIQGAYASVPIAINLTGGTNAVNVTTEHQLRGASSGNITINGGGLGTTTLQVDDSSDPIAANWVFNQGGMTIASVQRTEFGSPLKINFDALTSLIAIGGNSGNVFSVLGTSTSSTTQIQAGTGGDQINVGNATHNLDAVGDLYLVGAGNTQLNVNDRATAAFLSPVTFLVQNGAVYRTRAALQTQIQCSGIAGIGISGGSSSTTFTVLGTAAGTPLTLNAGAGATDFEIASTAYIGSSLDSIQGPITVNGGGALSTLTLNDQGATGREEYDIHSTRITREPITSPPTSPTQTIVYSGVASLTVNGGDGSGGHVFYAVGTPAGTSVSLNAGTGGFNEFVASDEYNPADTSPGTDFLSGPLAFHGHQITDYGERYDYYDGAGHTFTFSANGAVNTLQRDGAADLTYDGLSQMIVYVPKVGGNRLNVRSVAPGVFLNLTQAAGDQAVVGSLAPGLGGTTANVLGSVAIGDEVFGVTSSVTVDDSGDTGTAARRVTIAPPPPNSDDPDSSVIGLLGDPSQGIYWRLDPGSSVALLGGAGDTTFALQGAVADVSLSIAGGAGVNTLDYSQYVGDVTVNLELGTATGVSGGIKNIRNVTGSVGNDLLVGDANANVLIGGTGRNILIGGGGADQLFGSAGADNLLIGGTTAYDSKLQALELIMKEWDRTDLNFAQRMSDISGGGVGISGSVLAGTGIRLDRTTVFADNAADTLTEPTNSTGRYWFFADGDDLIPFHKSGKDGDHITTV